mmetsp:Transcript_20595/g.48162  ORF Transcript_20595/g.48162 Transcript_20595/m.48162 type:complete len:100 (-) Transcript_20595:287-586(-)
MHVLTRVLVWPKTVTPRGFEQRPRLAVQRPTTREARLDQTVLKSAQPPRLQSMSWQNREARSLQPQYSSEASKQALLSRTTHKKRRSFRTMGFWSQRSR